MPLTVGDRLGHYAVTALIGEGGMGQVYQVTDTKLDRDVALKVLPGAPLCSRRTSSCYGLSTFRRAGLNPGNLDSHTTCGRMMRITRATVVSSLASLAVFFAFGCGGGAGRRQAGETEGAALLLSVSVFGTNEDGSPKPLPGRMAILTPEGNGWSHRFIEDPGSNVLHKAMAYEAGGIAGILTLGGTKAAVKLWRPDGDTDTLWEADFGGEFSRMRDAEVGDVYGDGAAAIVVATHDQGVIVVLRPDGAGGFSVDELDAKRDTIVHEIELGDLDGDGTLEVYATPTPPNELNGTPQPGSVVRYVPANGEGPVEVADLGTRHAKEILVEDVDGDGRDELYVSVEAVSGGQVEIRRFDADTGPTEGRVIARLDDQLCRFLTAGDIDGDGVLEIVAATHKAGLWLLRRSGDSWTQEIIATDSSSFEHATILLDLDGDERDELYVASDDQGQVRRYTWEGDAWQREIILEYSDGLPRFTWNIMSAPVALLPAGP